MGLKTRSKVLKGLALRELRSSALKHMGQVRRAAYELPDYLNDMQEGELEDLVILLGDMEWDAKRAAEYVAELERRERRKH